MKIGITPPLLLESFFPDAGARALVRPRPEESAFWSAVGGDAPAAWFDLPDDPAWGGWSLLAIVDEAARSQYDGMVDHLRQGDTLPDRAAAIALTGREFHGQRGRPWQAERGNLHLTVHLAPGRPAGQIGLGFTLLPAVACIRAIRTLSGGAVTAGVKWVNDIVAGNRKLGGFLASTQSRDGVIQNVVLGLGINIEKAPVFEPTPFVPAVGCLRDLDPRFHLTALLPVLLKELVDLYQTLLAEGPAPLLAAYREYSVVIGQRVRVYPESVGGAAQHLRSIAPLAQGVVKGIADDLSLIFEDREEPVSRGRLALEDACRRQGL